MKKLVHFLLVLLTACVFLGTARVSAQATGLPFAEDFEGYEDHEDFLATSGWTTIDHDGDGHNWFLHYDSTDDQNVMVSRSWESDEGALTPENYLVTPLLALPVPENGWQVVLSFHVAAASSNYYEEHYKVVVSATGNEAADFDDDHIVHEETLTTGEGGWNYAERTIDLARYAGQEVYIAFVHYNSTNQDRLLINNVAVEVKMPPGLGLPFADDFEGYEDHEDFLATSGWTTIDHDGDGHNWFLHYDSADDQNIMVSRSWESDEGALTPENYLVTPRLRLPALEAGSTIVLSYDVAASGSTFFEEHYKVVVSAAGNEAGNFEDEHIVFEETLTESEGGWNYAKREVVLTDYSGQDIFIAFVHYDCTDQGRLLINNVAVEMIEAEDHDLPFAENFEAYENTADFLENSGWTTIDADGDGENWYLEVGDEMKVMASASWDWEPLEPENWLITPQIRLPEIIGEGYLLLAYDIAATGNNFYEERYKIVVSTTGNQLGDFDDNHIVFEETLTEAERGRRWARRHIDLNAYAGEAVYLAFVHYNTTDQDRLVLNNVDLAFVNSATVYPSVLSFNPIVPEDVSTNITWFGATEVVGVHRGELQLEEGTDYFVEAIDDDSSELTLMAGYFAGEEEGDVVFDIVFDAGSNVPLTVSVGASPEAAIIEEDLVDFDPQEPGDVAVEIVWNSATEVVSVSLGGEALDLDHYEVDEDLLTIFAAYFDDKDPGYLILEVGFDLGADASFIVRVFDHSILELPFEESFTGLEALGPATPEGWLPNGWRAIDANQDGYNWYYVPIVSDGEGVYGRMQSRSAVQDETGQWQELTPDNWLITPEIQLDPITAEGQEIELTFRVASGASTPSYRQEHYSVMISYTGLDTDDFVEIFSETISQDHPQNELLEREVELSFYEGQTVHIAFRHHNVADMDRLLLSHVTIEMHGVDDTGIRDTDLVNLLVYPNPAREQLSVQSDFPIQEISLWGILGNVVYRNNPNADQHIIQLGSLPEGNYILRAVTGQGTVVRRIQVLR